MEQRQMSEDNLWELLLSFPLKRSLSGLMTDTLKLTEDLSSPGTLAVWFTLIFLASHVEKTKIQGD